MEEEAAITRRSFLVLAARTGMVWAVAGAGSGSAAAAAARAAPGGGRMDRTDRLMALFRRRWAVPVLAELHRAEGAKFVTLVHRLDSNPGAMRETLDELLEIGWIQRNPGYGHPLRPEYLLTRRGERLAPACAALDQTVASLGVGDVAFKKWSMPVLYVVGEGPTRFTEIPRVLGSVTDRAVSLALKDLAEAEMIARTLIGGPPPGSLYAATRSGGMLLPILDRV